MPRSEFSLKIIRFNKGEGSATSQRVITETTIQTRRALNESLRPVKREKRLWLSLTQEDAPGASLWVAISEGHSWITLWADSGSTDTHAKNPTRAKGKRFIEFLLDNTQPQLIHESFTFGRSTAWDALGHFVVNGSPPSSLEFTEDLDTDC